MKILIYDNGTVKEVEVPDNADLDNLYLLVQDKEKKEDGKSN